MNDRSAFTIALGKPIYLKMAITLARSFMFWNRESPVRFCIVSDRGENVCPPDLRGRVEWKVVEQGRYGRGFTPKLFLDELAPTKHSLFIDADCLCVRSIDFIFDRFEGRAVSAVGTEWTEGEWCGDVRSICGQLGIAHVTYLNGGIYYIEQGEKSASVFQTARGLRERYDEIGWSRLRCSENDEPLISAAMAIHGQKAIAEDGTVMNTLMDAIGGLKLDVLAGKAILRNPQDHPGRARGHTIPVLRPAIMHLNSMDMRDYPYNAQALALELVMARGWSVPAARATAAAVKLVPAVAKRTAKSALRPLYHAVFGPRPVGPIVR